MRVSHIPRSIYFLVHIRSNNHFCNTLLRYTFLGVVAKEQHIAMIAKGSIPKKYWDGVWTNLFIEIASWWIIGIGCAYFLLGLICMKRVLHRCREQYQTRLREYEEEMK